MIEIEAPTGAELEGSPGQLSATIGHHFAHPTNHFWKCLHASGMRLTISVLRPTTDGFFWLVELTDRLLDPREDHILPTDYSIGLVRDQIFHVIPSKMASVKDELGLAPQRIGMCNSTSGHLRLFAHSFFVLKAAELANTEFTAGVPALLQKIVERRPRIVCFVGKGIWESFIRAVAPPSKPPVKDEILDAEFTLNVPSGGTPSSASASASGLPTSSAPTTRAPSRTTPKRTNSRKPKPEPFVYDLQPYKIVHTARTYATFGSLVAKNPRLHARL